MAGYKLNKIHDNYYLSLDQMATEKDLDGSWPSDHLEANLPPVSKSGTSISISGSTSDVTTRITFTPPSPQKYPDPVKEKKGQEEAGPENVPSQVEVFVKVAEKLSETDEPGSASVQEPKDAPQNTHPLVKEKGNSFESEEKIGKKELDDTEKYVEDVVNVLKEGDEKETWRGARKIEDKTKKLDEMQDSNKSSLVSSEWQSASESLTNQTESESDSDIQVLTDEDGGEVEGVMERGLFVGSVEEDEDSQKTLTRSSGILVLQKGEKESNQGGGETQDDTEDGISPARWSNSESGVLGSESSISSQQRSDSSLGFATEGLSQFMEVVRSDGASSVFQERGVFGLPQGTEPVGNDVIGVKGGSEIRTFEEEACKLETKHNRKVNTTGTEAETDQFVTMPQKQRNSSGDSSKAFSPRDQESARSDDSPRSQAVVSRDSSSSAHRVGRTRDTPRSCRTSSTGGTTVSGPLSAQVSCNSLSGSLTECDEEGQLVASVRNHYDMSYFHFVTPTPSPPPKKINKD